MQIKVINKAVHNEHKDDSLGRELEDQETKSVDSMSFATSEEIEKGKLPPEELLSLPMFKV